MPFACYILVQPFSGCRMLQYVCEEMQMRDGMDEGLTAGLDGFVSSRNNRSGSFGAMREFSLEDAIAKKNYTKG